MNSANLKDFRPDNPDFEPEEKDFDAKSSEIPVSTYHEEINTLKIDKLSNRVTIISIIIPCLIGAILVFAYLDMKERVVDADLTKQTQVDRISQQLEEKLNALDVKIAKNRFDLDNNLPGLTSKSVALEGKIAKLTSSKADTKTMNDQLAGLEKRVAGNEKQNKTTLLAMEKADNQTLSTIKGNQDQFDKTARQIKDEINLFKEEFDARLLELSEYEQQIGELRKNYSLMDKKYKQLEQASISQSAFEERASQIKTEFSGQTLKLSKELERLDQKLATNISRLQKDLDLLLKSSSSIAPKAPPVAGNKPKPQINIDSSGPVKIEENSLTE